MVFSPDVFRVQKTTTALSLPEVQEPCHNRPVL
jgi:hypothetical protein